jgi:hypothetical protein
MTNCNWRTKLKIKKNLNKMNNNEIKKIKEQGLKLKNKK